MNVSQEVSAEGRKDESWKVSGTTSLTNLLSYVLTWPPLREGDLLLSSSCEVASVSVTPRRFTWVGVRGRVGVGDRLGGRAR